jgi:AraC-like DNA-binding protein
MSIPASTYDGLLHTVSLDPKIVGVLGLDPARLPLEENLVYKGNDFARASAAVSSISEPRTFEALSSKPAPFIELRRARLRYSEIGLTFNNVATRMKTPARVNYYSKEARRVGTVSAVAKRVTSYIEANAHRDLTLSDLVDVSGMSARTLYSHFSEAHGTGPMAYLKRVQLDRCREDLLAADPDAEFVGDVAAKWGFYHLSSFARDYRRQFGELPSETLRRNP